MPASLRSAFPIAVDADLIGEYPAQTKSGGGYFYDAVLEYRVWVHPHDGGEDLYDGDDYYCAFATFEEASAYSRETAGAEQPLVLVRQDECINEPEPGRYEHHTGERLTEWRVGGWKAASARPRPSLTSCGATAARP